MSGDVTLSVSEPLVSVIVTSYDYGGFIADCLRSVHAQSYELKSKPKASDIFDPSFQPPVADRNSN